MRDGVFNPAIIQRRHTISQACKASSRQNARGVVGVDA